MKSNILEIEISTPNDGGVFFPCLDEPLRGRADFLRISMHRPEFLSLAQRFPQGFPGQIVKVDLDEKRVWIIEPLWNDEFQEERELAVSRGFALKHTKEIENPHLPDWLHQIKRTLDSKCATILCGKLPDDLGEERPTDEEVAARDRNSEAMKDLVETLVESNRAFVESQKEMQGQIRDLLKVIASK